ncbi:MAG: hypothetical protein NTX49_00350 [Chlamydiae bacterium]|nr:hypothetical protein [Chlamydiota bacterium]
MIPLTNPFSDPGWHFEAECRGPLSRFISRWDRENRAIDAVVRVIKIRGSASELMKSICCEAVVDLEKRHCFLPEASLSYPVDMLIIAAKFMDIFNECLSLRIAANPVMHNKSPYSMACILEDDFSIDLSPPTAVTPVCRFSFAGTSEAFWEEQKVVQELLEFGRE